MRTIDFQMAIHVFQLAFEKRMAFYNLNILLCEKYYFYMNIECILFRIRT